jgi:CubicO group peptidase (beta-lactamase class C family)
VITRVTGDDYRTVVERRILEPLGMTSTAFIPDGVDPSRLAIGHVKRGEDWVEEPLAGHGAFAPMGGLFTSVRDLAMWVAGFTDAFPARDDPDDGHPLSRATRREQQQVHRPTPPELTWESASKPPTPFVGGYGYGLFTSLDVRHGRIVGHGGGYPGFGSHMRWHPASGMGVVALANARYAGVIEPAREALKALITGETAPARRHVPWPATTDARADVERLLDSWDDELAARLFSMNVPLDEDLASRRAAIERLKEAHGALRPDETEPVVSPSPARLAWWLSGDRGRVQVEILMSPERPSLVQALNITSIPDPPAGLVRIAERVVALLGQNTPAWPPDPPLAEPLDPGELDRDLRAAAAMFGPLRLGPVTAGDGVKTATWRLLGDRGELTLTLQLGEAEGTIAKIALIPAAIESPVHLA